EVGPSSWAAEETVGVDRRGAGHPGAADQPAQDGPGDGAASPDRVACAERDQPTNGQVAAPLKVDQATVGKWRRRFVDQRLDGLFDEDRPGAPRTVSDDMVERVVVKTLEEHPRDATHWSTRSMAKATGMSATTVRRIWHAFELKPHLADSFKLSTDPLF